MSKLQGNNGMSTPKNLLIYLAGGMERRADNGITWRRMFTEKIDIINKSVKNFVKYSVFNPCLEESDIFARYDLKPEELAETKKSRNVELYMSLFRDIVIHDLKAIMECDIIVCFYDESVNQSSGTTGELTSVILLRLLSHIFKDEVHRLEIDKLKNKRVKELVKVINKVKSMPIYVIRYVSYNDVPGWTMGCVDKWFENIDDCVGYLKLIPKTQEEHKEALRIISDVSKRAQDQKNGGINEEKDT